ncbi:MAG TPA: hypothetical protein VE242_12835 [Chthoniobacterales bacterium]|nr:hypothetical protein [Chthoniobacterales bacterium]
MNTTVAFGNGYLGSSERTTRFVLQPALKKARTRELVVIPFPVPKMDPDVTGVRVHVPKFEVWAWLELGLVVVLAVSVLVSILLFLVATAGNI